MKNTKIISIIVFFSVLVGPMWLLVHAYTHKSPSVHVDSNGKSVPQESVFHTIIGLISGEESTAVPPPTSLQVASATPGQVVLRWTTTDSLVVTGYRVYRDGQFLGVVTTTGFGDADTVAGRTYLYSILALNSANQASTSADISVKVATAVATVPTTPSTPVKNTNTTTTKNTNTETHEEQEPVTNIPVVNQNTNTVSNVNTNTNTNTNPHTPTTTIVHVTQQGVVGNSTISIIAGDSIQFVLDSTNNEVVIRFTPSASRSSITLDRERSSRTVTFSVAGTYTFSSQDDPAVHGTINVAAS